MRILLVDQFSKVSGNDGLSLLKHLYSSTKDLLFAIDDVFLARDERIETHVVFKRCFGERLGVFRKGINYLIALSKLFKIIKNEKIDWVILQWFPIQKVDYLFIKKISKITKVCVLVHDVIPFNVQKNEIRNLEKIYSIVDLLILQGNYSYNLFLTTYPSISPLKIKKTNCAFVDENSYSRVDKCKARQLIGIKNDKLVFLFFGTIKEEKGLDTLIAAFSKFSSINKNAFLLVAGSVPSFLKEKYNLLVKKYLNTNNSNVCFRHMSDEEKIVYFSAADVLVLPYRQIYQSGSAQVGLFYGLPIIATKLSGFDKAIQNKINGIVIDDLSEASICDAMNEISSSDLTTLGINSIKILHDDFSLEEKAKDIYAYLKNKE